MQAKTEKKSWHQQFCHFSPSITAQAHKCCNGVPESKDDALCPILGQCTACIQARLTKKVSPRKGGFDPDGTQLPHQQCLIMDFAFAGSMSKDANQQQDVEGTNGQTHWLMTQDELTKMAHCDVWISKAPPAKSIDGFLTTHALAVATQKIVMLDQGGGELCNLPQMSKMSKKQITLCCQQPMMHPTKIQLENNTKVLPMLCKLCRLVPTCQGGSQVC